MITETRPVDGFNSVEMRAIGNATIVQGNKESLVIKGSDNLIPLIKTSVRNGTLIFEMEPNIQINSLARADSLSYVITVKDLTNLKVSGLGTVKMEGLETESLGLTMSGAGSVTISDIAAERLEVNISGLGNINLSGIVDHADVKISGAGEVIAGDLKCRTAKVNVPGLGSALLWVSDDLTGNISGSGNVRYYGNPKATTQSTGLGAFEALGSK